MVKWYILWDALTKNRTDGALVRLTTMITPDEPVEIGDQRLAALARDIVPQLDPFIPR